MRGNDGAVVPGRSFIHRAAWASLNTDTIERQFFTLWAGTLAYLACGYCKFQGTATPAGVRPMGYAEPARQDILFDPPQDMLANDNRLGCF